MEKRKLFDYVHEHLGKGFDALKIKHHLIGEGWSESDIDEAINLSHKEHIKENHWENQINEIKNSTKKEIPTGIKIISIWHYFGGALAILFGVLLFVSLMSTSETTSVPFLGILSTGIIIIGGIILLALGGLVIFIGRGLWKGKNWARITAVVFASIGILFSVFAMFGGSVSGNFPSIILNGVIIWYLMFKQNVKDFFA